MRKHSTVALVAALVMMATVVVVPAAFAGGATSDTFEDTMGNTSKLVRNDNGVSAKYAVAGLTPGNVYSAWVALNDFPSMTNPSVFLAGMVVGGSGKATFAGHVAEGVLGLDPAADTVFIVIVNHGPKVPGSIREAMTDPMFCGGGTCGPVTHAEHAPAS